MATEDEYRNLFVGKESLKEKNKFVFLLMQSKIQQGDYEFIRGLLADSALNDLHPSLLMTIQIMTQNLEGISDLQQNLAAILALKQSATHF